jgi:ketosteroid isomerase-like protein
MATSTKALGVEFAEAFAAKDYERLGALLHQEVDFRALTPNRSWEAQGPDQVVSEVLRDWIDDLGQVEELEPVESGTVANCQRVGYRIRGSDAEGPYVIEQQAYFEERDGQIAWIRVLCSGQRTPRGSG